MKNFDFNFTVIYQLDVLESGEVVFYNIDTKFKEINNQKGLSTYISNDSGTENYVLCLVQVLRNGSVQYADSLGRAAGKLFLDSISFKVEGAGWRSPVEESAAFERATICRSVALTKNGRALNLYGHVASMRQSEPDSSFEFVNLDEPIFVKTRSPFREREVGEEAHDREGFILCGRTTGLRTEIVCDTRDLETLSESRNPRFYWKFDLVRENVVRMFTEVDDSRLYLFADRNPNIEPIRRKVQVEGDSQLAGEYTELDETLNGQSIYVKDKYPYDFCCAMVQSPVRRRGSWINPDDAIYDFGASGCGSDCNLDHTNHGNCIQCGQDYNAHSKGHSCKPAMCWAILEYEGGGADPRRRFNRGTYYSECAPDTLLEEVYQPWQRGSVGGQITVTSSGGTPLTDKRPFSLRNNTLALSSDENLLEMTEEMSSSLFEVARVETAGNDLARFRLSSSKYPGCYIGLSTQEYPGNPYGCEMRLVSNTADMDKETSVFEVTMNPLGKRTTVCTSRDSANQLATGLIGVCVPSMPQEIPNRDEHKAGSHELKSHDFVPPSGPGLVRMHSLPHDYDSHAYDGDLARVRGLSLNHLSYIPRACAQESLTLCKGADSPEGVNYAIISGIVHITGIVSLGKSRFSKSKSRSFRPGFEILDITDEIRPSDPNQNIIVLADNGPFTETIIVLLGFKPTAVGSGQTKLIISHLSDSAVSRIFLDGVKWSKLNSGTAPSKLPQQTQLPLLQEDVTICSDLSPPHITKSGHVCYLGGAVEKKPTEFSLREFKHEKAMLLRLGVDPKKYEPKAGLWSPGDQICQLPQRMRPSAPMYFIILAEAAPDWSDPFDPSSQSQTISHSGTFGRSSSSDRGSRFGFGRSSGGGARDDGSRGDERGDSSERRYPPHVQQIVDLARAFHRSSELLDAFMGVDSEFAGEVSAPSISGSRVDALRAQLLLLLSENPQLMEAISDVNSELFTSLRDSIDAKPRVSVESVAGGHRLATGKFSCSSCRMMGPSFQSSELFCMGCGTCAVCCSQSGSMCSSAGPDAVASTHVVSNTPNQVDCIRCGHHSRSKNASQGRCSACSLCSVCCTKVPICVSAQPAYSAPSAVNSHPGCASLRPTQVGEHICKSCGGRYKRCMGSYGYRSDNGKGTWSSGPCPADLSQYPESPNPSWCTAECERLSSGNQPAGGIPALGTDLSAQLSAQLFAQFSAAQGQVAHVFEGLQQQLESPPMSEGESLIRDMIAQNAERDVIDAVLAGFDPAEAEAIRARIGL